MYSDPEGNTPYKVKFETLPQFGVLSYDGIAVTIGQVLDYTTEVGNGKLIYESDLSKLEGHSVNFNFRVSDIGSELYSNVGVITINVKKQQIPPTVSDNFDLLTTNKYSFKLIDFTKDYTDANADPFLKVVIASLIGVGSVKLNNINVKIGDEILLSNVDRIVYTLPSNYVISNDILYEYSSSVETIVLQYEAAGYYLDSNENGLLLFRKIGTPYITKKVQGIVIANSTLSFKFSIIEDSISSLKSNVATFSLIPQGNTNVEPPYVNQPPTVGNLNFNITHGSSLTITESNLLSTYSDIEGDLPKELKVVSLPSEGSLFYNNALVTVGQVVNIFELTYNASVNNLSYTVTFNYAISDEGSNSFSNNGTITILVDEKVAERPTVDDNTGILTSSNYIFDETSFTLNFADLDLDLYKTIKIKSLPSVFELKYLGESAKINTSFLAINSSGLKFILNDRYAIYNGFLYDFSEPIQDILNRYNGLGYNLTNNSNGVLTFTNNTNPLDTVKAQGIFLDNSKLCFKFATSDDSVFNLYSEDAEFCLIPQGNINVRPIYVNNPPIVGDNTLNTYYNKVLPLVKKDFIEDTVPKYNDPELDAPFQLKVLTLPNNGILKLNGVDVVVNQILNFGTDITTEPTTTLFVYIPDGTRIDIKNTVFQFAVSDVGSKTFAE